MVPLMKKSAFLLCLSLLAFTPLVNAAPSYPLKMCIVTGDELGDDPITATYKNRTILLCCKSCVKKFNANPEKYLAILDKEMAKRKK